jgi:probable F420-dependent oxidoreductase
MSQQEFLNQWPMKKRCPFRFGITSNGATTREAWVALARKVEAQGYSTLLISDHLHNQLGPIPALVAAAEVTTTLRVSSYVFDNDFRHPVFLAQEAATIDLLSSGRFELGLGSGWLLADYTQSGISFDPPGVRIARMEEAVQIIKGYWGDQPFTYSGAHYQVKEVNGLPKPVQKPRPPMMIGGGGQRVLSIAAREAEIVSINFKATRAGWADFSSMKPEAFDQKIQWVHEAAGERFDSLELNSYAFVAAVTDQPRQVVQQSFQRFGEVIEDASVDEWLASPVVLVGTVNQIIEELQMRRERFGMSYIVLRESVADAFAPVIERLTGT